MVPLSTAAYFALSLAASEARQLKHAKIEIEHVALGLLKIPDLAAQDQCPVDGVSQPDWLAARREIQDWQESLRQAGLADCMALRRRLRGMISRLLND